MKSKTSTFLLKFRFLIPVALLLAVLACNNDADATPLPAPTPNIPATVQAQVTSYVDSLPTATPWPTNTPYPTGTPFPTHTPYPTATALPTHTPYPTPTAMPILAPVQAPTQAPLPTYTPFPTYTPPPAPASVRVTWPTPAPAPTATPVPRLSFDEFAALDTSGRVDPILRTSVLGPSNCERVADLSIELSQQQDVSILKVYDMRVFVSNSRRVECAGTARLSQGENAPINIFAEHDGEGDNFYGYRFRQPANR